MARYLLVVAASLLVWLAPFWLVCRYWSHRIVGKLAEIGIDLDRRIMES